jgi:hypothetical protein
MADTLNKENTKTQVEQTPASRNTEGNGAYIKGYTEALAVVTAAGFKLVVTPPEDLPIASTWFE